MAKKLILEGKFTKQTIGISLLIRNLQFVPALK